MQGGRERLFTGRKINKKDIFTCFVESRGRHAACFLSTADAWRRQARRAEKSGRGERNSRVSRPRSMRKPSLLRKAAVRRASDSAMCKAVEVPAGFPGCRNPGRGTRQQCFRPGEGAERVRAGGSVHQSGLPGVDREWGQWRVPKAQDFGLARCVRAGQGGRRRRTACSDSRPACRRAGATLVQCPVLRRIRALPVAGGGAASLARVLFRAQAVQSCGAEREAVTVHGAGSELGAGPGRKQVFRLRRRFLLRFVASGDNQGAQAELERPGVESRKTAGARRAEGGFADCSGRRPSRFPVFSRRGSRRVSIMSRKQPCGTGALGLRPRVPAVRRRCGRAACPALPAGSFPGTHGRRRAE